MKISQSKIKEFEAEILNNKKKYFLNCNNNYSEYVEIAKILFYDVYLRIKQFDKEINPVQNYVLIAKNFKNLKDVEKEIEILRKAILIEIYIPGVYERLAIIYENKYKYNLALEVCNKWFNIDYWKLPNMSSCSKRLLERKERLESILINSIKEDL